MTKNRKISVLLAEDEQTLAMIIKDTLDAQDFNITPAADGEEALRLFLARKPDVLVADVMMPHMDGFELVRRIRRVDSHTPVLFLTARSSVEDVVKGFELGANDYLKNLSACRSLSCDSVLSWAAQPAIGRKTGLLFPRPPLG